MSEVTAEEERARKLEEAKKRVEELKSKKNKKKNKKKAKDVGSDGSDTPIMPADSEEPAEETKSELNEKNDESAKGSATVQVEPLDKEAAVPEDSKTEEAPQMTPASNQVDDLFGEQDGKQGDFMTSIQQKQSEDEVKGLQEEVQKLKEQIKNLKFVNIEQETTIEDLEEQVGLLKSQVNDKSTKLNTALEDLAVSKAEVEQLKSSQITQTAPVELASFDRHSPTRFNSSTSVSHPSHDPALLAKWKNWHVDMTSWRSIGVGPVVEF